MQRGLRQTSIPVAGEGWLVALPQRLMTVHSRSVIAKQRLRHKRGGLAVLTRSVLHHVFENLQVVGRAQQIRETKIDLALTGGSDFVVQTFDVDSAIRERQRNLRSQID